jgi:hypothetical protein
MTAVLGLVICLAAAPSAGAATTVGSDLSHAPNFSIVCSGGQASCAFSQAVLPSRQVTVPADGVLVRWRSRVSFSGTRNGTLRVLRSAPGGNYTAVSHGATTSLTSGAVGSYEARLPVLAGDLIAMSGSYGSLTAFYNSVAGAGMKQFSPPLADGVSGSALAGAADRELLLNADIEPDADADGYGDETQDGCPSDPASQSDCRADLQVTTTASAAGIGQFTDLTFFVKVRNIGPQKAYAAKMTDALSELMRVDTITTDAGSCAGGPTVTCDLGTVDAAKTVTIKIEATGVKRGSVHALASGSSSSFDPNPANNSAAADTLVLNPGACGNNSSFGAGADHVIGSAAGDQIAGGAGDDTLMGGAGYDCLIGGAGNDKLYGESADDRLSGGPGNDTLDGGSETDTFSGGSGNDVIDSRDKISEKVNCGRGRDRVRADRKDKLKGCEKRVRK